MSVERGFSLEPNSGAVHKELYLSDRLLDDLFVVLTAIGPDGLRVLKRGGVSKAEISRLSGLLNVSPFSDPTFPPLKSDRVIRFLLELMFEQGLLVLKPDESVAYTSDTVESWLSEPLETQLRRLYEAFLHSSWDELYMAPNLRIDISGRRNAPRESRAAILSELAKLEQEKWYRLDDLAGAIYKENAGVLRPPSDPYNWSITILEAGSGHHLKSEDSERSFWFNLEGNLVRNYVYDPLYWLGVVKLGLDRLGHLSHFAIAENGKCFLTQKFERGRRVKKKTFVLQADFEVTADRHFDRSALLFLDKFANRAQADAVFKFQITKHSIAKALQQGIEGKEIIAFLEKHSEGGMPQNVEFSIKEWSARFGNIRIRDAVILETADEFLLSELLISRRIAPLLEEQIGEKTALVDPERISSLYNVLKREGYLPELDDAFRKAGPGSQSYSFSQQQSVAVFASALALSYIMDALNLDISPLRRLLVDEEFLSTKVPYKLMLQASFLSGEISDVILGREEIGSTKLEPTELPPKPAKSIKDNLNKALTLGQPVVIEYLSPILQKFRFKKMTVSEIIDTQDGGYVRGIDHQSKSSKVLSITAMRNVSALK